VPEPHLQALDTTPLGPAEAEHVRVVLRDIIADAAELHAGTEDRTDYPVGAVLAALGGIERRIAGLRETLREADSRGPGR
jgi:hypothetical protein